MNARCLLVLMATTTLALAQSSIPLDGRWGVSLSDGAAGVGEIRLPGTLNDAGLGPRNAAEADLSGPYPLHVYEGPAWYEREIEIPYAWEGQRITLFLERCRWTTTVWLDDKEIGSRDSLSAPHVYELGSGVISGSHRLRIRVDNTPKHDLGVFVSALKGGTWGNLNGIVGRIELQATPLVWIDAVQVYPDLKAKSARVQVRIGNVTGEPGRGDLVVGPVAQAVEWGVDGGLAEVVVDMSAARLWDEFSPEMQTLRVQLGKHEREVRFGMREMGTDGTRLTMNGRPVFLRGTLECSVWPLTGYPPTDVAGWARMYRIIKSHGLNHMRFHSWCPPEAAFVAADEEGVILQVEGPCANVNAGEVRERDAYLEEEYRRIVDTYGNHPSFCLMTLGNEFGGDMQTLEGWVGMLRQRDPRHLYSSSCNNRQLAGNRQFTVTPAGRGIHGPGTLHDAAAVVAADPLPVIGHEIGQWTYWPDPQEMSKWTGVMELRNYRMVHDDLERKGLAGLERKFVDACGQFATLLYKEEIELLLRTPGYAGYQLLDLHDYPTQGTALVGPLDAFWDSKGFITADGFRRFAGESVPLLRLAKRTYASDEPFAATVDIAHHGAADFKGVVPSWQIADAQGGLVARGVLAACDVPTGTTSRLGTIEASLQEVTKASRLTVTVSIGSVTNDWQIWVYPPAGEPEVSPEVVVCDQWDAAKAALADGRRVLFHAYGCDGELTMRGKYLPVFWSPVWFPKHQPKTMSLLCNPGHPMLQGFPTEMHSNWQWCHLMEHSRLFVLDATPARYLPTVQVIDNFARNHKLGVVFEAWVGEGKLLVNGFNLQGVPDDAAVNCLRRRLIEYAGSDRFRPKQALDPAVLDAVFARGKPAAAE